MTVLTSVRTQTFSGVGVTQLSLTFPVLESVHLIVQKKSAAGVWTTLLEGGHYSVVGVGLSLPGTVNLITPLAAGEAVTVTRSVPLTQPTDLRTQGKFSAEIHEKAFDRRVMQIQDVRWYAEHLIVDASSQAEEDEAFRLGAKIVIRSDLITGTTAAPTTTTTTTTTTSSTTSTSTSSTTSSPPVLLPATLAVANITSTSGMVSGSNVVLDPTEFVEYAVTTVVGGAIFDLHITGTSTASGFIIVNLGGVDVNIGEFPAGTVDIAIGPLSIIGPKNLRFRIGTGLGGGTLTLAPVEVVPASFTTTATTTTSTTTTAAPSIIPVITTFEIVALTETNPFNALVGATAGTGGLITAYGFGIVLNGATAPTVPNSWSTVSPTGGLSGSLWVFEVPGNGTYDVYFFVRDQANVTIRSIAETVVVAVPAPTTTMSSIPAPVITSPTAGATLYTDGSGQVTFTGTGVYGTTVNLEIVGATTIIAGDTVLSDGTWQVAVARPDGAYTVRGRLIETGTTNVGPWTSPVVNFTIATVTTTTTTTLAPSAAPTISAVAPNPVTVGGTLTVTVSAP